MAGNGATGNLGMALDRSAKEASPKVLEALEKLRAEDAAKAQARGDPDWTRREKVCSILTAAGVDAPMALKLSGRRDLTEAGVSELVAKVRSSRAVRNLPAVIVARLTKKVGAL
jgi:hypothetical protein